MKKIIFAVTFFITIFYFSLSEAIKIPFGHVVAITGKPLINEKPARIDQKVFVKDRIITDSESSLEIKTKRGDRFVVGPESDIVIKDRKNVEVKRGTLRSIINLLKPDEAFNVITTAGVAGVKGTEFLVYSNKNATAVFTKTGWVSLENKMESVVVKSKEMSQSAKTTPPISPINYEKDRTLKNMYKILISLTDMTIPAEMKKMKSLPNIIARWNINYTTYLLDKRKFNEAIKLLSIAFYFATIKDIKAEALFQRSMVISRFLKTYFDAIRDLNEIIDHYSDTKFYESALFQRGFIEFERKSYKMCKKYFLKYKKEFPKGKYIFTVDLLLKQIP